jgi:predicted aldo/keto reductase-like oxidoreductase
MQYRRFGRTELRMPVFSCGGMRYQQSWEDVPLDQVDPEGQRNLEATIDRSIELGINHIETARGYGSSERQLGLVLPKYPRDEIIVQTKIAPTADPQEFAQHFRESLERLRLDHVDLLAIHGINNYEMQWHSVRPGGCLSVAREFQREGKARHIGFSTHGSPELILDTIRHEGDGGFDYVNLHWYYIYQRNWPAIEAATARDMGVFIISPADKGGMLYRPSERLV